MQRTLPCLAVFLCAVTLPIPAEGLKAVTYNVGLLKVLGSNYVPQVDARAAAAPGVIARFASENSPDIILLEEIWRDAYAKDIEKAMAPLGYSFVYPDVHTILGLTSGLLLAVKAPLRIYGEYPNEPPANIDHVFIRDGTTLQWKAVRDSLVFDAVADGLSVVPAKGASPVPTPLSDHYGFEAELELGGVS